MLVPRKLFHYFGIADTIAQQMFTDASWCAVRGKGRDDTHNDCRHSPEFARLRQKVLDLDGPDLNSPDASTYSLGLDCGQMFKNRSYSCGVVGVKIGRAHV